MQPTRIRQRNTKERDAGKWFVEYEACGGWWALSIPFNTEVEAVAAELVLCCDVQTALKLDNNDDDHS